MDWSLKYPYLWELSGGKLEFMKIMLTTFIQSSDEYKKELELSKKGTDKEISLIAHKIKSALKIVGAIQFAYELEILEKNPNSSAIADIIEKLDAIVIDIQKDVESL
jgi:HPt (histidine-containing phosphotransfer) domain-containing protein